MVKTLINCSPAQLTFKMLYIFDNYETVAILIDAGGRQRESVMGSFGGYNEKIKK